MISTEFETQQEQQTTSTDVKPRIMIVDDNVELLEELETLLIQSPKISCIQKHIHNQYWIVCYFI